MELRSPKVSRGGRRKQEEEEEEKGNCLKEFVDFVRIHRRRVIWSCVSTVRPPGFDPCFLLVDNPGGGA